MKLRNTGYVDLYIYCSNKNIDFYSLHTALWSQNAVA